ncbi:hypothetical protein PAT3040_04367 [Paenibacillus agaridevorans]|uniref:Uncharacterized protein n=1 Tax=Paenibacillus agaridevorans TaxID=171404 RepID=A0A2R5EXC4_9BACL|nr:hypothetical protein PAT3040_04367 [Paenibacillus agaridevorans]
MDRLHWLTFVPYAEARYVRVTITAMNGGADARASIWSLDLLGADRKNFGLGKPVSASSWRNEIFRADKAMDGRGPDYRSPVAEGLIGRSIVATGHTYADMYMAYKSSQYYRLYLFTGDAHYLHVALLLQHNVNRLTDWDGTKGYSHPGLIEEGAGVAEFVYRPIDVWLTWCTVAQLEPLSELEDRFGTYSIDRIEELPLQQRIDQNRFRNF